LLIIGGLYFELQSPGIGFALIVSLIAAVLYFAPLYLEGLAANWEIVMFIVGVLLIVAELFFFPGFGIAGIAGIVLVVMGLTLASSTTLFLTSALQLPTPYCMLYFVFY
jgi:membrane-bound serine protease (ClpP class)